ncbi:MAG: hypothetical protein HY644_00260 [Acidobacteria bacterium]|nr:hypothetical protein [Acidobacteriota bacterium]
MIASYEDQRGEGRLGCLIVLLLALIFGFVSFKVIPVYIDRMNFEEDLAREASRAGANFWTDEKMKQDVLQMAGFRSFQLQEKNITISRSGPSRGEVRIEVKYSVPVRFPRYTHVFNFQSKSSSIVGSF